ncbi:MAG: hypothetical protein JKY23_05555 [Nitrospinaceae bacterium]|nr:hypothetical protein [Nitrospinaceae bacterium]
MFKRVTIFFFITLFFSGCAEWNLGLNNSTSTLPPAPLTIETAYPFSDIPVPFDFTQDNSKSFIYESGSGTVKVGRFIYTGWDNIEKIITFYQNEMINRGWSLINSIKHENYILNYEKEGWVSTIILHSNIGRTIIEIQAGPK